MSLLPSLGALLHGDAGAPVQHGRGRAVAARAALELVAVGVRRRVAAGGAAGRRALHVLGSAGALQTWGARARRQTDGRRKEKKGGLAWVI